MAPLRAREIAGFVRLTIQIPATALSLPHTLHDIFVKPHEPQSPEPDSYRSLFLGNVPTTTTDLHIRQLFHESLSAGRVERVEFLDFNLDRPLQDDPRSAKPSVAGKKRKRSTSHEMNARLDSMRLPEVWQRRLHASGAHAVAIFVDRPSMETSLKAIQIATKLHKEIPWGEALEDQVSPLGLRRYVDHLDRQYPSTTALLRDVNSFIDIYTQLEEARSRESAKKRQVADEDGFVMVTKGSRGGVLRREEAQELRERQQEKSKGLENFYRFQMRERRKEQQNELLRKFEEDRRKVEDMKVMRGNIRVCSFTIWIKILVLTFPQPE